MSAISTLLTRLQNTLSTLRAAIWAIDVRDDIADAIEECGQMVEQCYSDVSNPTLQTEALEAALQNKIDQGEMAALTIGDRTITAVKLANGVIPAADATLTTSGGYADAAETGRQIGNIKADLDAKVDLPSNGYGTSGKVLRSTGTGTEWATVGQPTDAQTAEAVTDWLNEHPEATTTVQDESITEPKLAPALKKKISDSTLPVGMSVDVLYNKPNDDDYNIIQGGCAVGGNVIVAFTQDGNESSIKLREFSLNGFSLIRESQVAINHANSITAADGNLYITDYGSTKKIHTVRYSDLTIISTQNLTYAPFAICINAAGRLVALNYTDFSVKEYALPSFSVVNEYPALETELKYGANQADMEYYNGRYYLLLSAPKMVYVYDESFSLVKTIDVPERLDRISLMETEFITSVGNDKFIIGWNTPILPTYIYDTPYIENIFTVTDLLKGNSYNKEQNIDDKYLPAGVVDIYVDKNASGSFSDGNWRYPYKEIQQALNDCNTKNMIIIRIKAGTYCPIYATNKTFRFDVWQNQSTEQLLENVTINSMYLMGCSASIGRVVLTPHEGIDDYALRLENGSKCLADIMTNYAYDAFIDTASELQTTGYCVPVTMSSGIYQINENVVRTWRLTKTNSTPKVLGRVGLVQNVNKSGEIDLKNGAFREFAIVLATLNVDNKLFTSILNASGTTVIPFEFYSGSDRIHGTLEISSDNGSKKYTPVFTCYKNSASYVPSYFLLNIDGIL